MNQPVMTLDPVLLFELAVLQRYLEGEEQALLLRQLLPSDWSALPDRQKI